MQMRILRQTYEEGLADLLRPHPFAAERVAFLFGRLGSAASEAVFVASGFASVQDDHYIDDADVGARIGSDAIRKVLQLALSNTVGVFHVHLHDHAGTPRFSRTDLRDANEFVRPFRTLVPTQAHGMVVFSRDSATAMAWMPGPTQATPVSAISIVGFPISIWRGGA